MANFETSCVAGAPLLMKLLSLIRRQNVSEDTVGKPHFRASIILCLLRKQAQMVPDQEGFPTVSTLVNDELIDIGFPKIRARSISRNNSSIPRFTKVGHEPWNSKIYRRRESSDIPETTRTPLTSHTKMRLRNQHTGRSHHA